MTRSDMNAPPAGGDAVSTDTQDSREVVEIVARAMCAADGFEWEKQFSHMTSANGDDSPESYLYSARAALTAIEASGWKIVPVEVAPASDTAEVVRVGVATAGENLVPNPRFSASPKVTR